MKNALIINSKGIFVEDIIELLKKNDFAVSLIKDNVSLGSVYKSIINSALCVIVATFDETVLQKDNDRQTMRPRVSPETTFFAGIAAGIAMSNNGSNNTKVIVYKRDLIYSPLAFNVMPSAASLSQLEEYIKQINAKELNSVA